MAEAVIVDFSSSKPNKQRLDVILDGKQGVLKEVTSIKGEQCAVVVFPGSAIPRIVPVDRITRIEENSN